MTAVVGTRDEPVLFVSTDRPTIGGRRSVALEEVVNEHFLARYRALLDEEDAAFDELEHAFEDGDRQHFETDLRSWCDAINAKLAYLQRSGVANVTALVAAAT